MSDRKFGTRSAAKKAVLKPRNPNPFTGWDDNTRTPEDRRQDDLRRRRYYAVDRAVYGGPAYDEQVSPDGTLSESVQGISVPPRPEAVHALENAIDALYADVKRVEKKGEEVLLALPSRDFVHDSHGNGLMDKWVTMLRMLHRVYPDLREPQFTKIARQTIADFLSHRIEVQLRNRTKFLPCEDGRPSHVPCAVRSFACALTEDAMFRVDFTTVQESASVGAAGGARQKHSSPGRIFKVKFATVEESASGGAAGGARKRHHV